MELFGINHSYMMLYDLLKSNYSLLDVYVDELDLGLN